MTETEVKIRWAKSPSEARGHIERSGFHVIEPRTLERDQLFDRPIASGGGELKQSGQALRLRLTYINEVISEGGMQAPTGLPVRATLTYKGPQLASIDPKNQGRYKSREEIECDVSDANAFVLVLARLGYQPAFRYEKYRTKFARHFEKDLENNLENDSERAHVSNVVNGSAGIVTIDETPMGVFLELEGSEYWIEDAAKRLDVAPSLYITASYAALYREYREEHPETPVNMVFTPGESWFP